MKYYSEYAPVILCLRDLLHVCVCVCVCTCAIIANDINSEVSNWLFRIDAAWIAEMRVVHMWH